ncbi:hypothetical protein OG944_03910 [Streptomyces anulatus]|uniref:hypothetical protein n=1 Tax=Streptomyces anulatus TaxID=1892 RepID=UPI00224F7ED0|nr:hypothetical protein [Streptomyces anulatus]MCX4502211.1 hypothetical protein [Streptomyces anulatus]
MSTLRILAEEGVVEGGARRLQRPLPIRRDEDTTDTGTWAGATHLTAMYDADFVGSLTGSTVMGRSMDLNLGMEPEREPERPIYDTLP